MADSGPPSAPSASQRDDFRDRLNEDDRMQEDHAATTVHLERVLGSKSWRWTQWIRNVEAWIRSGRTREFVRPRGGPVALTVLIPIYNAFEHVVRCVGSVLLHTPIDGVRILLLDDASTDPRVASYLADVQRSHPHRVTVVRHHENIGFLKTANQGFSLAPHSDVLLLNSDTIVGPHWAESLQSVAAEDALTASVTAVSNNASIYSVLSDHVPDTPDPQHIALLAEQIYRAPGALRPRIPTGVGFCMLFTKQALEVVGTLDEAFSPGYGEENDWCQRAAKKGFRHILDDRCFIYHVGHASMHAAGVLPKNTSTLESHERLLESRHSDYTKRVRKYLTSGVQEQVASRIERACPPGFPRRRTRIAFLLHQPLSYAARGGVERHVLDLVRELKSTRDCTVISPHRGLFVALRFVDHLSLQHEWEYEGSGETKRFALIELLSLLNPDLIHVQHVGQDGFGVLGDLSGLGKKIVYSIHDSSATHTVPHPLVTHGTDASRHSSGVLQTIASHFAHVSHVIAPSQEAADDFLRSYPECRESTSVIEHGLLVGIRVPPPAPVRPTVCFLGAVSDVRKGSTIISAIVPELLKQGIAVTFLGSRARQFPTIALSPLVRFSGTYDPSEVVERLRAEAPSVVALLSLFPETFSFTAHEALAAGIPLFMTPVGVFPRMVREKKVGRVSSSFAPEVIAQELIAYLSSDDIRRDAENTLASPIMPRVRMAEEYVELYRELLK